MARPAQNVSRSAATDPVSESALVNPACPNKASKEPPRHLRGATSSVSVKAAKKPAANQKTDERRRKAVAKQEEKAEKLRQREVQQNETDDRFTSPEMVYAIEYSFGRINFDPCWHKSSAVRPDAYLDVRQGHNGLRDEWSGDVVFVNPPWSAQDKFVRRAHDQWRKRNVRTVVCLVPAKTDTVFFHQTLIKDADLYFVAGRPSFFKEDGTFEGTMVATMLVIFGATDQQKMRLSKLVPGAWWPASQASSDRAKKAPCSSFQASKYHGLLSCAALHTSNDANWTVFCNPSVDRSQNARRA